MKQNTSHWIDQSEINHYLFDVRKYSVLSREEEFDVVEKIKNGCDKSKEKLISANLRFVISMAKQYQNQGLSLSDLISEGNLGLIKAAERYDYNQTDVRFLSYAVWWVKQCITQAINEYGRTIRIPVNVINDLAKFKRENRFEFDEVMAPKSVLAIPVVNQLDGVFDEEGGTMHDIIEDKNSVRPDLNFSDDDDCLLNKLRGILNILNDSEKYVVIKYFGLDGDALTLQDISEDLDLTKERVRQIKEKAIKKLRFHSRELFELL